MASTNVGIVKITAAALLNATWGAAGQLAALNGSNCDEIVNGLGGTRLDKVVFDLSTAGYALNGAGTYTLSGTTPVTVDLTNLATNAAFSAGDTVFAKFMTLVCYNTGAADVTIAPGGSNPASIGLAGTTPTLTIPAGKQVLLNYATAGVTVDGTHKNITVTPTAGGSFALVVGGA